MGESAYVSVLAAAKPRSTQLQGKQLSYTAYHPLNHRIVVLFLLPVRGGVADIEPCLDLPPTRLGNTSAASSRSLTVAALPESSTAPQFISHPLSSRKSIGVSLGRVAPLSTPTSLISRSRKPKDFLGTPDQ